MMSQARRGVLLLVLVTAVGLLLTGAARPFAWPWSRPRNLILIIVDTLRSDHVGCYGAELPTTPTIDSLAACGTRFVHAYATAPWTLPSIASILTGRFPKSHGANRVGSLLSERALTLPEHLQKHGYATAGVVSHSLLAPRRGFAQGFEEYRTIVRRDHHNALTTGAVTDTALRMLEKLSRQERPYFLLVHYFDPHYNYLRHPEYGFAPDSAGRLSGDEDLEELQKLGTLTREEYAFLRALYDEEIRHTDAGIGRLLGRLRQLDRRGKTAVILTADHGEEFGRHQNLGHSRTLYEEVMRIPLIVQAPGRRSTRAPVNAEVSLVSLFPTVLDILDVEADTLSFQGPSLVPLLTARGKGEAVYFGVDFEAYKAHKRGVLQARRKLIFDEATGGLELYDLRSDSTEQKNAVEADSESVREILPILVRYAKASRDGALPSEVRQLDQEEIEQLRSLGYIN